MSKLRSMRDAIAEFVPDGSSVAMGLQMEQMIPFAAGHEIIRQRKRNLTLIGPISDILFDQLIGAGCVEQVIAAWIGVHSSAGEDRWVFPNGNAGSIFNRTVQFRLSHEIRRSAQASRSLCVSERYAR